MLYKVAKKFNEAGFWGTLRIILNNLVAAVQILRPSFRRNRREENAFDTVFGVETSDKVEVCDLDVSEDRRKHLCCYQPTRVWLFNEILNGLQIRYQDYIFVDIGSGKGRVLLMASTYPFKKIIGVELSRQLHEMAVKNVHNYKNESQCCHEISSCCIDANNFEIPDENMVLFFYNPFDDYVMGKVLSNIEASFMMHNRSMILVYINPIHSGTIDKFTFLQTIKKDRRYCIYASKTLL